MALDPTVEQQIARAKEAFARNAYLAALEDLQAVAARHPGFADIQNLIGLCLSLAGRPEEALAAFARATELNPGYVEAHLNLAITLNDLGRLDEAHASFQRAAEADEEKTGGGRFSSAAAAKLANRHMELGDLYAEAGGLEEALEQYRRAAELRPQFLDIGNKLARALIDLGRTGEAIDELQRIVRMNASFVAARANLGLALYRAGRLDAAGEEWRRCLAQQPGNAQVSSYLGMLERQREGGPREPSHGP
ncbi:MAG TPA: tetratricopeptide repeat protein [Longimicrobiaceae bacterium]|nr:tetratricopeptide repeat protein [Longimicrobiaceae bacterium]